MPTESTPRVYGGELVTRRREQRRVTFLEAGLQEFGTRGYQGTSITAICRTAGLARAQFYEHFAGREDLLLAVHEMVQTEARIAMRKALADAGLEPLERAAAAVRAYALSVGTDPRRARVSFVEIVGVSERVEQRRDVRREDWVRFFREEVRAVLAPDAVPPGGFDLAAAGFIGALTATVHRWSLGDPRAPIEELADTLASFLVAFLTADG